VFGHLRVGVARLNRIGVMSGSTIVIRPALCGLFCEGNVYCLSSFRFSRLRLLLMISLWAGPTGNM